MKNVIIIFGGKSGEHEVSVNSAISIESNINKERYETSVIGVSPTGKWSYGKSVADIIQHGKVKEVDGNLLPTQSIISKIIETDIIFPIIHGPNGEDGTIQGLLELANIPYVGSKMLGSSMCLDKVVQKQLCHYEGIPQPKFIYFEKEDWQNSNEKITLQIEQLIFPLFIKPANTGSSLGISKIRKISDLQKAVDESLLFDNKIIVEESIEDNTEIQVGILGNTDLIVSVCGSIKPFSEFYDYETKYITNDIETNIPAQIPNQILEKVKDIAKHSYKVLNCSGMARIDFFYKEKTGEIFLDEINTAPGFTEISMYPKLFQASKISYSELISKLLQLAEENWKRKQNLKTAYSS